MMQSVHAFASDPGRGTAILVASVVILLPAFILYALRVQRCCEEPQVALSCADVLLTAGIFLTVAACAAVLIGTVYPLFYELAVGGSLTVGAPYFNQFFAPMAIGAALLISILQAMRTGSVALAAAGAVVAVAGAGAVLLFTDPREPVITFAALAAAFWLAATSAIALLPGCRRLRWAAIIAHLGIAVTMLGATGVSQYESEALVRMDAGSGKPVGDVIFVNRGFFAVNTRSYFGEAARIEVLAAKDESLITTLFPMRQTFISGGMQMSAAGIGHGLTRDYYVSMGNQLGAGEWLMRLSVKPLASWIWAGAFVMMLSGVMVLVRPRRREDKPQGNKES